VAERGKYKSWTPWREHHGVQVDYDKDWSMYIDQATAISLPDYQVEGSKPLPLAALFPEEVMFWKKKFLWASSRRGFNVRTSYEEPWLPRKRQGLNLISLFPALVDDIAEAHLDFERFARNHDPKSLVKPKKEQLAFWAGTWAGEYTYSNAIDIDAHHRVGHAWLPARYHPDKWTDENRPGYSSWISPYSHRWVPLTWIGLDYFKTARLVYDHFPGRLWAFSSASLGLGVWRMFRKWRKPEEVSQAVEDKLKEIGLKLEVYPAPSKSGDTMGRQHRRPCGMDSGVITDAGVITDPIAQIRQFMSPVTPSFPAIVRAVIERSRYFHAHSDDLDLWAEQKKEFRRVVSWLKAGCPDCESVLRTTSTSVATSRSSIPPEVEVDDPDAKEAVACHPSLPECFRTCDLKEINARHLWVEFVMFLARDGFPCDDSFEPVISTLSRWLWFYELHHLEPDDRYERTVEVLTLFVEQKHNGYVTRLERGDMDVFRQIGRIVRRYTSNVSDAGQEVFTQLRYKRDSRYYREEYQIVPLIDGSSSSTHTSILRSISCDLLTDQPGEGYEETGWVYVPDDTPLPYGLARKIIAGLKENRISIRRNADGEYPTLKAITRLINYLKEGGAGGRRASQELLRQLGFQNRTREQIKRGLYRMSVIRDGGYRAKSASRRYVLDSAILEVFASDEEYGALPDRVDNH
jgi:hypothetical protein